MATINGTSGNDTLNGTASGDTISGSYGDDTIYGNGGNDTIYGGDGRDSLYGGDGDDVIHAGPSDNYLFGEYIWDGAGNDTVYGGEDEDLIYGSPGNDYYDGGTGGTVMTFEADQVSYSGALAGIVVDMRLSSGQVRSSGTGDAANIGVDTLLNLEAIGGSSFNDVMTGGSSYITLGGGAGNDKLTAGAGGATLRGGDGGDILTGGVNNDWLEGGAGDDVLDGGAGFDRVSYSGSAIGVTVSLGETGPQNTGEGTDTIKNIEYLIGSELDDSLTGGSGADFIDGGGGDDTISGGAGNDFVGGGFGQDTFLFSAGDGQDTIDYMEAGEIVEITDYASAQSITQSGNDVIVVLSATDRITFKFNTVANVQAALQFSANPTNTINGTSGSDFLIGTDADDTINGLAGEDRMEGGLGNDAVHGGDGEDALDGGEGNDALYGEADNDTIFGGFGDDYLDGGEGVDMLSYLQYGWSVNVSLGASGPQDTGNYGMDTVTGFENLTGTQSDDILGGDSGANVIDGFDGYDIITGGGGDDHLFGGGLLIGDDGNDTITVNPATYDVIEFHVGDDQDSVFAIDAADQVKIYDYNSAQSITQDGTSVIVVLSDTDRITFYNTNVDWVQAILMFPDAVSSVPTEGDDTLDGTGGDDTIDALGGNDTITGLGGNDILDGGAGNDWLDGGDGNDRLDGGTGDDAMAGGAGQDKYFVDSLGDTITELLGGGSDTVHSSISWTLGANIESLILDGTANINGTGNNTGNVIRGTSGINSLSGGGGGDRLFGNAGNDTLHGGAGNDKLEGGAGQDLLIGSTGADSFVFRGGDFAGLTTTTADRINDFSQAEGDTIDLGAVDADSLTGGDQAFTFIGTGAFTNTAGELRYQLVNTNVFVYGDTNGDGIADFMIRLANFTAPLTEGDFVI